MIPETEIAKMKRELVEMQKYVQHLPSCPEFLFHIGGFREPQPCTCGVGKFLAKGGE